MGQHACERCPPVRLPLLELRAKCIVAAINECADLALENEHDGREGEAAADQTPREQPRLPGRPTISR